MKTKWFAIFLLLGIILACLPTYASEITDTPCLVDASGDNTKELVYITKNLLFLKEADGSDVNGWPYKFADGEYCMGGTAIYDLDGDGKEEIIVKGVRDSEQELFCKVLQHTAEGPRVLYDFSVAAPFDCRDSKIVVGDVDGDSQPEIIIHGTVINLNGRQKFIIEGIVGTPMVIENDDEPLVVFYSIHALYCIRLNWEHSNDILWRIEFGESAWGELGSADLDGDGRPEIVATAGVHKGFWSFEYRVIKLDGRVVKAQSFTNKDGFSCAYDDHTRFVIADIGENNPRAVFFTRFENSDYYNIPQSQPACAYIDDDERVSFFMRGWRSLRGCFFRLSPELADPTHHWPYDPVICPLSDDNVTQVYYTSNHKGGYSAPYLSHVVIGDMEGNGYFTLAGAKTDGSGLDFVKYLKPAPNTKDWPQGYGNSRRTNSFAFEEENKLSIELIGADWKLRNVGLNEEIPNFSIDGEIITPQHIIENKSSVPVDITIKYAGWVDCEADTEPGENKFATLIYKKEPIPTVGETGVIENLGPEAEVPLLLVYCSPTGRDIDIDSMKAFYELRAYPSAEEK